MKNIAIFVSGAGESAERIVRLFNEGNRLKTVVIVTDDSAVGLGERLKDEDVEIIHVPDEKWLEKSSELASLIKEKGVKLLVLDGFDKVITDELMETTSGEMVRVSDSDHAPREVVAALEADLRKPVEEIKEENKEETDPTPESEWADALKIQFRPPKIPMTPPVVPVAETEVPKSQNDVYEERGEKEEVKKREYEPMPSTWLIWSILVTVFCCFIPGIIAIIFSSQVSSKYYGGDIEGARRSSRMAEIWIIVSFVLGVLSATLYLPFMIIGNLNVG